MSEIRRQFAKHTPGFWLGIGAFLALALLWRPAASSVGEASSANPAQIAVVGALALLMVVWWMTEACPSR